MISIKISRLCSFWLNKETMPEFCLLFACKKTAGRDGMEEDAGSV